MKVSNTIFNGTHFIYTCSHCSTECEEPANPTKNPNPFSFNPSCSGCGIPKDPDYEIIARGHAAFTSERK